MPHSVFQRQSVPLSVKYRARLMGNKTKQVGRRKIVRVSMVFCELTFTLRQRGAAGGSFLHRK